MRPWSGPSISSSSHESLNAAPPTNPAGTLITLPQRDIAIQIRLFHEPSIDRLQRPFRMDEGEIEFPHELWDQDRYLQQANVFPDAGTRAGAELFGMRSGLII